MIRFKADSFIWISREVGRLSTHLETCDQHEQRDDDTKKADIKHITDWRAVFDEIGMNSCADHAERIAERCKDDAFFTNGKMQALLTELGNRIQDDSARMHFIHLSDEEQRFYAPAAPAFGKDVSDRFPSLAFDIDEAGKCLGLRRSTAAVFHLMRVMEAGVQRFGSKLGVPETGEKVWQVILDGINANIKNYPRNASRKRYASIAANLYNVKVAWRNETMHPKATYSDEEAENIFRAVKSFMVDLAEVIPLPRGKTPPRSQ